jgi:hypothetical protein
MRVYETPVFGHGFSRAVTDAKSTGLQPLRALLAVLTQILQPRSRRITIALLLWKSTRTKNAEGNQTLTNFRHHQLQMSQNR